MIDYFQLAGIAKTEFADIIQTVSISETKIRIILIDNSFIDFWWSKNIKNRFAHHWERRHIDGSIYRHDNASHKKWQQVKTFPKHFHFETDKKVTGSYISEIPEQAIREFLLFARNKLRFAPA